MEILLQVAFNGLIIGLIYVLMALGLTLIFGVTDIMNFAHGEFYMLGAFISYITISQFHVPFYVSFVIAIVIVGILAILTERLVIRRLRANHLNVLIATLALSILFQHVAQVLFGADNYKIPSPLPGVLIIGGLYFPNERLFAAGTSLVLLFGLYLLVFRSSFGRAMRAVAQNPDAAALQGIQFSRVYMLSFAIGCGLAAAAGCLMGPIFSVTAFMGPLALGKAFIVIILAGIGSIRGAVIGGIVLGIAESFASTFIGAQYSDMIGFGLVMLVLILKPSGLFGIAIEKV